MADPVLSVRGLSKSFGAVRACRDVSFDLRAGEIHALIGPNGAGKSTLVAQVAGALRPDAGTVTLRGRDVTRMGVVARARMGLARSFQVSAVVPERTVLENIVLMLHGRAGQAFRLFGSASQARRDEAADHAARVGLAGRMDVRAAGLAHGERRRLELAMALAMRPEAFLLDEPMAGMGADGAAAMTALLDGLRREAPILLIEHDMDAVFRLADRVSVLVEGAILATGPVAAIRADPRVRAAYLGDTA